MGLHADRRQAAPGEPRPRRPAECQSVCKGAKAPEKQAPGGKVLTILLTNWKERRYLPLVVETSTDPKGLKPYERF